MASTKRMTASNRKQAILDAARPLFAQNGFHGTSVRDIARAADVSEALLYKHFPSKEAMYDEILDYPGAVSAAAFEKSENLEPGAEALVIHVYFLVRLILFETPGLKEQQHWHERLLFHSLIDDTKYAQSHFKNIQGFMADTIATCCEVAIEAGDMKTIPINHNNKFWFVHHLAMALNLCHMSDKPAFDYEISKDELAEQAVLFCLRGLGMTDSAINRYFRPEKLRDMFARAYQ